MSEKGQGVIQTPQGGGSVSGLGEKFSPDLFTGTGNFSVPIAVPQGVNGFQPQLTLGYSTGSGNGPFGLGWSIGIPGVMRKTAKGVPMYDSTDVFILSGAEDLVDIGAFTTTENGQTLNARQFRPRTEGLFARILYISDSKNDFWKVTSKDGLTSYYGTPFSKGTDSAVISDPKNAQKVFGWKLSKTLDTFGNRIEYTYFREAVRKLGHREWDQSYLERIDYIHYTNSLGQEKALAQVHFEYESRPDPFSEYKQGFEVRTNLRCTKIITKTEPDGVAAQTVHEYNFLYADEISGAEKPINGVSLLHSLQVTGISAAETESMPPLTFSYTNYQPRKQKFKRLEGNDIPLNGLNNPNLTLISLFGNGLPDILEVNGQIRYWRNLGNGKFDRPKTMREAPAGLALGSPNVQLMDANGDGRIDMLVAQPGQAGYFSSEPGAEWDHKSFVSYKQAPSFGFSDPNMKMVDLTGSGITDVIYGGNQLACYFSDPIEGWTGSRTSNITGLEGMPAINFSDQRIKMADMSGDGMQDIVFIESGIVKYWPSLGYGNFAKPVRMNKAPKFPFDPDPARIFLSDVDGDGLDDVVYVAADRVYVWINQSGNGFSDPVIISGTPLIADPRGISVTDVLGNGTAGVLFSADMLYRGRPQWYFLDLTGGIKPYLLAQMDNNMGSLTRVEYKSSTHYYLKDQEKKNTRWKTTLPFPVQVVAKTEVVDKISLGKLSTVYEYHHGYWDGAEREFRGFGRVDTYDTEVFEEYNKAATFYSGSFIPHVPGQSVNHGNLVFIKVGEENFSPPTLTRNWFHLGPVGPEFGAWKELFFEDEYWSEDPNVLKRPTATEQMLQGLSRRIKRDAIRTLRGSQIRTEVYTWNQFTGPAARPFSVSESIQGIQKIFEKADPDKAVKGRYGIIFRPPGTIFFPFAHASRSSQWEEGNDPLTTFSYTGAYDNYGQPQRSASLALPRGIMPPYDDPRGTVANDPILATFNVTKYVYKDTQDVYICDRQCRAVGYKVFQDPSVNAFDLGEQLLIQNFSLDGGGILDPLACSVNYFDGTAFTGLPFGQIGDHGAVVKTETLVIDQKRINLAYGANVPECFQASPDYSSYPTVFQNSLQNGDTRLGYFEKTADPHVTGWYRTDVKNKYDFQVTSTPLSHPVRGLVLESKDGFDNLSKILYDSYGFLPTEARQYYDNSTPAWLATSALYDYRTFKPLQVTDENGNRSRFEYSPMGLLKGIALIGQYNKSEGDIVTESPLAYVPSTRFEYDLLSFYKDSEPVWVKTIQREKHWQQDPDPDSPTIKKVEFSDGFGRVLQARAQAEDLIFGNALTGDSGLPAVQTAQNANAIGQLRVGTQPDNVVVSGWKVYNNKGKVVEEYEPFFDKGYDFKPSFTYTFQLQKMQVRYDAGGRPTETIFPDGSRSLIVYGVPQSLGNPPISVNPSTPTPWFTPTSWERYTYDQNDLSGITGQAYTGAWTPKSELVDALGRTIKTTEHKSQVITGGFADVEMFYEYDIQGNLIQVRDPYNRQVFEYNYNLQKIALFTEHIDSGISRVTPDALGKPVEGTDAKNARTLAAYDRLQRPLYGWAQNNSSDSLRMVMKSIYGEGATNPSDHNLLGKLYEQYDEAGKLQMPDYDFKGNLSEKQRNVISDATLKTALTNYTPYLVDWTNSPAILDAFDYVTNSQYDALNRVTQLTLPEDVNTNRKNITPSYNRAGALEKVNYDSTDYVEQISYNAKGQRLLIAFGNGMMTRYAYDAKTFRLLRQKTEGFTRTQAGNTVTYAHNSGTTKQDDGYRYDLVGNILEINLRTTGCGVGGTNSLDRTFGYDPLYRLLSASGRENVPGGTYPFPGWSDTSRSTDPNTTEAYTRKFTYDKLGNIEEIKQIGNNAFTRQFNYPTTGGIKDNNKLSGVTIGTNSYSYSYDACGNQLTENSNRKFEWDAGNRLLVFYNQAGATPSIYTQYLYDGAGNRVKKITYTPGTGYEIRVYIDGVFEYLTDEVNTQNTVHIMDDKSRIATVRLGNAFGDSTPAIKYVLENNIGSSMVLLDTNGAPVNEQEYYPFGETSFGSYAKKRYQYVGKERDEESGMYYYGARYYSPWIGRFVSVDPLAGDYPFYTPYNYAGNKPINKIDIDGMQEPDPTQQAQGNTVPPASLDPAISEPVLPVVNGVQGPWSNEYMESLELKNIQEPKEENNLDQNQVGQEIMRLFAEDPSQLIHRPKGINDRGSCSPSAYKRIKEAIKNVYGEDSEQLKTASTSYARNLINNAFSYSEGGQKNYEGMNAKKAGVTEEHRSQSVAGFATWTGTGEYVNEEGVWAGKLTPGALLGLGGHVAIFVEYVIDPETNEIIGITYWDSVKDVPGREDYVFTVYKTDEIATKMGWTPTTGSGYQDYKPRIGANFY